MSKLSEKAKTCAYLYHYFPRLKTLVDVMHGEAINAPRNAMTLIQSCIPNSETSDSLSTQWILVARSTTRPIQKYTQPNNITYRGIQYKKKSLPKFRQRIWIFPTGRRNCSIQLCGRIRVAQRGVGWDFIWLLQVSYVLLRLDRRLMMGVFGRWKGQMGRRWL